MCIVRDCQFDDYQVIELKALDPKDPLKADEDILVGVKFINDQCFVQGDRWFPLEDTDELKALRKKHYTTGQSFFFFIGSHKLKVDKLEVRTERVKANVTALELSNKNVKELQQALDGQRTRVISGTLDDLIKILEETLEDTPKPNDAFISWGALKRN